METVIRTFNDATREFLKALDESVEQSKRVLIMQQVTAFNQAQAQLVSVVCALFDLDPLTTLFTEKELEENFARLKELTGFDFDPDSGTN